MHTLHYVAVEADNKQQAFDKVVVSLSREDGHTPADWSDWHVVGGGRWSTNANKESENNLMGVITMTLLMYWAFLKTRKSSKKP